MRARICREGGHAYKNRKMVGEGGVFGASTVRVEVLLVGWGVVGG